MNEAAAEGNAKVASKVSGETSGKVKSQGSQVVSGVQSQGGKVGSAFAGQGQGSGDRDQVDAAGRDVEHLVDRVSRPTAPWPRA